MDDVNAHRWKGNIPIELQPLVRQMYFGPYLDEWKVNGIVDNRDKTIAERLKLSEQSVKHFLEHEARLAHAYLIKRSEDHFEILESKMNNQPQ